MTDLSCSSYRQNSLGNSYRRWTWSAILQSKLSNTIDERLYITWCFNHICYQASGPELIGGTSGESEERIRQLFETALAAAPSIVFIDALDVISGKKDSAQRGMDRRIVAQLFDSIDLISMATKANTNTNTDVTTAGVETASAAEPQGPTDMLGTEQKPTKVSESSTQNKLVILIAATNKWVNVPTVVPHIVWVYHNNYWLIVKILL